MLLCMLCMICVCMLCIEPHKQPGSHNTYTLLDRTSLWAGLLITGLQGQPIKGRPIPSPFGRVTQPWGLLFLSLVTNISHIQETLAISLSLFCKPKAAKDSSSSKIIVHGSIPPFFQSVSVCIIDDI